MLSKSKLKWESWLVLFPFKFFAMKFFWEFSQKWRNFKVNYYLKPPELNVIEFQKQNVFIF